MPRAIPVANRTCMLTDNPPAVCVLVMALDMAPTVGKHHTLKNPRPIYYIQPQGPKPNLRLQTKTPLNP